MRGGGPARSSGASGGAGGRLDPIDDRGSSLRQATSPSGRVRSFRAGRSPPVHPDGVPAEPFRPRHVVHEVVADVHRSRPAGGGVRRIASSNMAGSGLLAPTSPAWIAKWNRGPMSSRRTSALPLVRGADHVAPAEGSQHLHRVLVVLDGVPGRRGTGGEEHLEPGAGEAFRLRRLVAGPDEGRLQYLHPELAHVVLEVWCLRDDRRPDLEQGVAVVARRHVRTIGVEPGAKVPLRALDRGLDVPQRVVEVEGDRADRSRMDAVGGHVRGIIIAARPRGRRSSLRSLPSAPHRAP